MVAYRALILCTALLCGEAGRPSATGQIAALPPTEMPARIVWVQPISDGNTALLATDDGTVYAVAIEQDALRTRALVRTHGGVRWGGAYDRRAYAFDRYAVYAFARSDDGGWSLRWRVDDAPSASQREKADPEFITRIVDIAPTRGGALVARSDGRLGFIAADDGTLVWQTAVARARRGRLLVDHDAAVWMAEAGGALSVSYAANTHRQPSPRTTRLEGVHPIVSRWTAAGLVLVDAGTIRTLDPAGGQVVAISPPGVTFRAALTVIGQPHNATGERPASVWTITPPDTLLEFGASTGPRRVPLEPFGPWLSVRESGGFLLCIGERGVVAIGTDRAAPTSAVATPNGKRPAGAVVLPTPPGGVTNDAFATAAWWGWITRRRGGTTPAPPRPPQGAERDVCWLVARPRNGGEDVRVRLGCCPTIVRPQDETLWLASAATLTAVRLPPPSR